DISRAVKHSNKKFVKIDKPPVCQKLLQKGKRYRLVCEPEAEITPEEIEFVDGSLLKLKSYIEVYLEKPDDFTLSLVELESDATVWKAKLRESDWIHYDQNKNEQKRSAVSVKKRKPALSILEDELCSKKQKTSNTADGIETKNLTDQQLMVIAKLFGRQWREIAIECLQMEMKDIEQIQAMEEEVNMQKFLVLSKWRDREQSNGTAEALYRSLHEKASYEILQALQATRLQRVESRSCALAHPTLTNLPVSRLSAELGKPRLEGARRVLPPREGPRGAPPPPAATRPRHLAEIREGRRIITQRKERLLTRWIPASRPGALGFTYGEAQPGHPSFASFEPGLKDVNTGRNQWTLF
ncbi:PREDICTED: uncharacterized protein LOC104622178, partial [Phaethon lepturus]|uniref:uncharacterized protein LOC104622178 n=1 Tax=Phaethon lepturus TaxID=97097 RepID=UPI00053098B8